nr:MAG TPA: hypothetical protein [Caudoviricetes sp.]DAN98761.1 MAG TPA: hypothetical protein [Caudoviricetes sp.]
MRRRLAGGLAHGRPGDAPIHIGRARDEQVRPTAAGRRLAIEAARTVIYANGNQQR